MDSILRHLILKEASFPILKLVWDKRIEADDLGELPKLTPTHYLNENRLSTDDRHKLLCRQQRKIPMQRSGMEVVVEPPIIVFQNYKFGETYSFPILVRNISRNSQKVALLMDESYVFKFNECSQRVAKFPCGMCITATITFTPENPMEDYYHKLVVSTNTTKVVVPIICIGPRPLLNAPDSVIFSDSPVKYWAVKSVNMLNVGKKPAKFTLTATSAFCVRPEKGVAEPNQAFTFEVAYYSPTIAVHEGEVCIRYDSGEEIYVYLRGNAVNCDIKLSSQDVRCEDTYMGLQTRATFYIENNSNITTKYYWKTQHEFDDMLRFQSRCDECPFQWKDGEGMADALEQGESKPISYSLLPECEEVLQQVKNKPDNLFISDNFQVYPVFGEIKPKSKTEVQVIFSPAECAFYEGIAYLEINGIEKRIPFSFYGRGLGPKFRLGFEVLDVGEVALGGTHTYEVPIQNISEISGVIQYDGLVGLPSAMGIKVEPSQLLISPDQYSAFYVNFTCTGKPGPFEDEIKFYTPDNGDTFYLTLTGTITYPTIRFSTDEIRMGNLSYGFPKTFSIPLVNDSLNYVNVELKMEHDGTDPPIDFQIILNSFKNEKFRFDNNPAEFKIAPVKFTLKPRGVQRIELTMFPNQVREVKNKLRCWIVDHEGNDVETVATVNIRGTVIVPMLQAVKDSMHMKDCYLHFPYPSDFIIKNSSELPVLYCFIQKPNQNMEIYSENFIGVADPWVETVIPFSVLCNVSGETNVHFDVYGVGVDEKMFTCSLKVESIPSKIEASSKMVDFGKIDVLEEKICTVDIVNTSPLSFPYTAQLTQDETTGKGESWSLEPETGILPSQTRISFMVNLLMKEVGWHYANIRIQMNEPLKHTIEVKIKALGVGCPLQFTPKLDKQALIDFGTIFTKQEKVLEFEVKNLGINPRVIDWKGIGEKPPLNRKEEKKKKLIPPPNESPAGGEKRQNNSPVDKEAKKTRPSFVIHPMHAVIPAGGTSKITITAHSSTAKLMEEIWNIWTFVPATKPNQNMNEHNEHETRETPGSVSAPHHRSSNASNRSRGSEHNLKKGRKAPLNEPANLHLRPVVLAEARLVARFENPGLKFSTKCVNFFIEATPAHENFIVEETLRIENVGSLPLRVRLRTKFPFSFRTRHDLEQREEHAYDLEIKRSLSFKIRFDGQHLRKELGRVIFEGKLEATCEGFMGVDTIDLVGEVKFPELTLERNLIDFGTITNGMEAVDQITVTNYCNFCLTYKWYIKPGTTKVDKTVDTTWGKDVLWDSYRPSINTNHFQLLRHKMPTGNAGKSTEQKRRSRELNAMRSKDNFSQILGFRTNIATNYDDFTSFIKEKMYRSRMMEFMGLKDAEYEAEDEVNYLAYYNQSSLFPKEEFNTNELIDVIPLAGVVQAGQSQTFTIVFYGYPDINFKTNLVLYVEGGARKNVEVRGTTIPPKSPGPVTEIIGRGSLSSKGSNSAIMAITYSDKEKDDDVRSNLTGNSVKSA